MFKNLLAALMIVSAVGIANGAEEPPVEALEKAVPDTNWVPDCPWLSISSGGYDKLFTDIPSVDQERRVKVVALRLGLPINDLEEKVNGVDFALLGSTNVVEMNGLQVSTLLSWPERFSGLQISGFSNASNTSANGVSIAPIVNLTQQYQGFQLALMNAAYPDLFTLIDVKPLPPDGGVHSYGAQLSVIGNLAEYSTGAQLTGVCNAAVSHRGVQCGLFNQTAAIEGSQIGLFNITQVLSGLQVGVSNYSSKGGVQIALFNIAESETIQFGLINTNPSGFLPFTLFVNF